MIREAEWSEEDVTMVEALLMCEELTCRGCGCWLPESTHDDFAGTVEQDVCYGCSSLAIIQRKTEEEHKDEKPTPGRPFWTDGHRYGVRASTPAELVGKFRPE